MPVPPTATNTPVPEATINCNPDLYASSIADVVGVWGVISGIAGKGNLEFKADGTYAIIIVQPNSAMGITAGFVMDSGNFHFEGTRLKLENASCQDAQGNLFACVGIYGACVTRQGDQPARLTLVAIDDKFTGRRQGLTPKTPFFIIQP